MSEQAYYYRCDQPGPEPGTVRHAQSGRILYVGDTLSMFDADELPTVGLFAAPTLLAALRYVGLKGVAARCLCRVTLENIIHRGLDEVQGCERTIIAMLDPAPAAEFAQRACDLIRAHVSAHAPGETRQSMARKAAAKELARAAYGLDVAEVSPLEKYAGLAVAHATAGNARNAAGAACEAFRQLPGEGPSKPAYMPLENELVALFDEMVAARAAKPPS